MSYFKEINLHQVRPDPDQPRKVFDAVKLAELTESIKAIGVKQAITVRLISQDDYMIIAGERRYRASIEAGKTTIPAVIVDGEGELTEDAIFSHQISENLHREDLNPVEKAEFIQARIQYLESQGIENPREIVANELGVSLSWISKSLSPLKLSADLRALAQQGKIRDYATLKKLDGLKAEKRQQAVSLIASGQFNSKEFFSGKRKKKEASDESGDQGNNPGQPPNEGEKSPESALTVRLDLSIEQLKQLISKTEFQHNIDTLPDDEKVVLFGEKRKELVKRFIEWFTS